ncbi:MAG: phosphoribosylaminoimidazolesuccinocarboxamide synthase [Elusimicrobiota bacterium]
MSAVEAPLPFKVWTRGKVRDVYDLGDKLLIVASDRISAYDSILPTPIPQKGILLTQLSNFWFEKLASVCPNHLLETDAARFPAEIRKDCAGLAGRAVLVRKAARADVECVVRGSLAGSGWKEYQERGEVCGVRLPPGLKESSRLPEPIFTPATKAEQGAHDENISFDRAAELLGRSVAEKLRDLSLKIFAEASRHAAARGFLLADTKFEFGRVGDRVGAPGAGAPGDGRISASGAPGAGAPGDGGWVLIDEALTPDSSRFWDAASYAPGRPQDSFDKQYVRDYLDKIRWDRRPPAPPLPPDVAARTRDKYVSAYERLTDRAFAW